MSESFNETFCPNCIHYYVCSIHDEYMRIVHSLPKSNDNFDLLLSCKHFMKYVQKRNDPISYGTTTGNPCGSKIDI